MHHRRNMDNPGNVKDCLKGKIRFMTAITPICAHAYQVLSSCLTVAFFTRPLQRAMYGTKISR